jgi:hypothetical protein
VMFPNATRLTHKATAATMIDLDVRTISIRA